MLRTQVGTAILHGLVHSSSASADSPAGRSHGLLPLVVLPQGRKALTLDGFCREHDDSAYRLCAAGNFDVLSGDD